MGMDSETSTLTNMADSQDEDEDEIGMIPETDCLVIGDW